MSPNSSNYLMLLDNLPRFHATPEVHGTIRSQSADFEVTEFLSFEPLGEGEHLFLFIEKIDCNTDWIADKLRKQFGLRTQDIGYAGKKDRYSVSRQWFSLHLPGREVSLENEIDPSFKILRALRHNRKLRLGAISHNHFKIVVRELNGEIDSATVASIRKNGFPNYFGYQRFGRNAGNLNKVEKMFAGEIRVRSRNQRGLYLSAARSLLFNLQIANRLQQQTWNSVLRGDCLNLNNSQSFFVCEQTDTEIIRRFEKGEIHVSGWLPGQQDSLSQQEARETENEALLNYLMFVDGLKNAKMDSARRSMRVIPEQLSFDVDITGTGLLTFSLPSGSFATALLRELFVIHDAGIPDAGNQEEMHD